MDPKAVLIKHFPDFEKELLEEIAGKATLRRFEEGDELMDTGQPILHIPLIYSGNVKIYREDDEGHELFLYYLEPGDACAVSMICSTRERMSLIKARAVATSEALMIPVELMDHWMQRYPSWYRYVLETYQTRMDELLHTIDAIAFKRLDDRLLDYLRKNAESQNSWELHTRHQTIANELNTSREVVSRLLKKLEQRGVLELGRNRIKILDFFG